MRCNIDDKDRYKRLSGIIEEIAWIIKNASNCHANPWNCSGLTE